MGEGPFGQRRRWKHVATIIKTCPDGKDLTLLLVTTTAFPKGTRLHENGAGEELIGKANSSRGKKTRLKEGLQVTVKMQRLQLVKNTNHYEEELQGHKGRPSSKPQR